MKRWQQTPKDWIDRNIRPNYLKLESFRENFFQADI